VLPPVLQHFSEPIGSRSYGLLLRSDRPDGAPGPCSVSADIARTQDPVRHSDARHGTYIGHIAGVRNPEFLPDGNFLCARDIAQHPGTGWRAYTFV
jgi:hypothetical protein